MKDTCQGNVGWQGESICPIERVSEGDCVDLQEAALELYTQFNCCVVFLGKDLKEKYYKGIHTPTHTEQQ